MLTHTWTITDTNGNVTTSSDETPAGIDLNTVALAANSGGCGIFPVGISYTHVATDECGNASDPTTGEINRCYVFGGDGSVLICNGEPFCLDPGTCACGA